MDARAALELGGLLLCALAAALAAGLYRRRAKGGVHVPPDPLLRKSAVALARMIRAGETTAEAAVLAFVAQQRRVNPHLNAVVATRYEEALAEARAADARLAATAPEDVGLLPPFLGVPLSVKEALAVEGMPLTSGLPALRDAGRRADRHSVTVQRLVEAGFIVLGVTNTSELCMWWESSNRVYGICNNPYELDRVVGGSSGGEGAIIAAAGAPAGLGSDIGGSVRIPSAFNGIFGHKPSALTVPNAGQFPNADSPDVAFLLTTGPMCRYAEDLWPMLRILAGPSIHDEYARHPLRGDPRHVDLGRLRVLVTSQLGPWPLHRGASGGMRGARERAVAALQRRGAHVEEREFDLMRRRGLLLWTTAMSAGGGTTFRQRLTNHDASASMALELLRWCAGRSDHTLPAIGLALVEDAARALTPKAHREALLAEREQLRAELNAALGADGVMIVPAWASSAPRHHEPFSLARLFQFGYTCIFNALGNPVTHVPLGLDADGMPVGVQVVGAHGRDALCVAVAEALEREVGGWTAPS